MREGSCRYQLLGGYESPFLDRQNAFIQTPVQEVAALFPGPMIWALARQWNEALHEMQKCGILGIEAARIAFSS